MLLIRKCLNKDITAAGKFYDRVVEYLDAHINYPKWQYKIYPNEDYVRQMTEEGVQYLCEEDGKIIGAFVLNTDPQGDYDKASWGADLPLGSYLVIHALAVDPALHGRGTGSEVVRFCIDKARKDGYSAVRLDLVPTNTPASKLYEKNGFTYVGTTDLGRGVEAIPEFSLYELNLINDIIKPKQINT